MDIVNNQTDDFYTIEMNKTGEELLICYWCFDQISGAQQFLECLKTACTAHNMSIAIFNKNHEFILGWQLGDEYKIPTQLFSKTAIYEE